MLSRVALTLTRGTYGNESAMNQRMPGLIRDSFTGVRGIEILRTSSFGLSPKFAYTVF